MMTRRVYDEGGFWTEDGNLGSNTVRDLVVKAFEALEEIGFNPREAGLIIEASAQTESLHRMAIRRPRRLVDENKD